MDYAGAELAEGMTTRSLRPIFEGKEETVRPFVASGLDNWRMAVQQHNGTWFKFVCCAGKCKGAPSTVPPVVDGWTQALYDIENDRCDMRDLSAKHPEIVEAMRPLLPASFGCGNAPSSMLI